MNMTRDSEIKYLNESYQVILIYVKILSKM